MRAIFLGTLLISTPALAEDQALKPFSFLGYVAGETIPAPLLKGCAKGPDITCIGPNVLVSNRYVSFMLTTHNYKLSTMLIDGHPNSFSDLFAAFNAKYGKPCESTVTIWRNLSGAELENPTYRWCFRSGKMLFSKYGAQIDKMGILYEDLNKAPEPAPKINF